MIDAEAVWLRLTYTASGNPMDYRVGLVTTQPTYGGRRWWFLCPLVRNDGGPPRRVAKLYLPPGGAYYLSMQRVRFRSADDYAQFSLLFSNVREHLKQLPGFIHLSWWVHPDDPTWFNEVSFWTSKEAIDAWHNVGYHKAAKKWAAESGAIIEDVITNFSLESTRLLRICPCCHRLQDFSIRPRPRAENARAAVPRLWFSIPGHEGNARLLRGLQGPRARSGRTRTVRWMRELLADFDMIEGAGE